MKTPDEISTLLLHRLTELERARTRALATQQWAKVIALESAIKEVNLLRKHFTDSATLP